MNETPAPTRNHAMDNLRVIVVFLVVVLHAIISYMEFAPPWWYALDAHRSLIFTYMVLLIDVPIMQIMFLLAGYYAWPSLTRRGPASFFREKIRRIGIPWGLGALILAPPTAYLIYYSRRSPMSLWTFWRTDFWGPAYQQSVYWYLGVLLMLFAATAVLFAAGRSFATRAPDIRRPKAWQGVLFIAVVSAASIPIATRCDLDLWSNNYLFVYQPVRIPDYIGYFFLGFFAGRWGWFTETGFQPRLRVWGPLCVLSGLLYVIWRMTPHPGLPTLAFRAAAIVLFNLFCLASSLVLIVLSRRYFAGNGRFWRHQARNSYGVYYLHPLFLYPLAVLFVPLPLSIFLKATILVALSYAMSLAASSLVLTRLPGLRHIF